MFGEELDPSTTLDLVGKPFSAHLAASVTAEGIVSVHSVLKIFFQTVDVK